jgi:4-amino-4-deoxy-L-arabinose transferase-like glycosyltransferase
LSSVAAELEQQGAVSGRGRRGALLALALIFLAVYGGSMLTPPLLDDADSTHAEAAREMAASGDYVTLKVNGIRYLEKAPLPYWMAALAYRTFGVNEFSTRLPNALAVLLLAMLGWRWASRAFGEQSGEYTGLFVLSAAGVYLFTRIFIPDALLSLLIAASLYYFLSASEAGASAWRWYAGYACVALGILTKGLIAAVFVGGTAAAYLAVTGDWRRWREFRLFSGLALLLAIAAPWHVLAALRNQRFLWFYFVNEHFLRFLGRRYPRDYNKLPGTLYWSLHLVWLFPWSLYFPAALRAGLQHLRGGARSWRTDFAARTRLVCWILAGTVLLFFSLSTNQEYYTFPAYLPLLLLTADGIAQQRPRDRWLLLCTGTIALVSIVAGWALAAGLWHSRHLPFTPDIATVLATHNMSADTLSMSHALDLSGQSFAALRLPAALAAAALLLAPLMAFVLQARGRRKQGVWVLGTGIAILLVAAHMALARFGTYLSSARLASDIAARARPSDQVMIYGDQAFGSSLLFYLGRPIKLVNGRTTSMWFGSTYPDAPRIFLSDADLQQLWNARQRILLFVPAPQKEKVAQLGLRKYVFAEVSGKTIYSNQP